VYSWITLNAIMSSFDMDVCTETFATLIKFMTSINWSMQHLTKFWRGLRQSDVHVKGGHFEHLIWFKSTHMLMFISKSVRCWVKYIKIIAIIDLLYFLICSDTSKVRWEIWHDPCRKLTVQQLQNFYKSSATAEDGRPTLFTSALRRIFSKR